MLDAACHLRNRLRREEEGASLVEYALLLALVAMVCFGAVVFLGTGTGEGIDRSSSCITAAQNRTELPEFCP